jgi:hypothetical protein
MGKYKLTVGYVKDIETEDNATVEIESVLYYVTINKLDYQKRIFAPGYIHVKLLLSTSKKTDGTGGSSGTGGTSGGSGDTASSAKFPNFSALQENFSRQLVTLVYNNGTEDLKVADNYFVYKMKPIQEKSSTATSLYVELFCYSMDKLATIDKYCYAYTARKLGGEIFTEGIKKFILTPNPAQLQGKVNLQFLNYTNNDNIAEIRQPYLVQYNESFYDFLARSAIRCGEMLYFEGGSLNLGMKPDLEKASDDQSGVADSVDYEESVDHVLDVEGCHYDFTMRSSENDNRYVDSPTSLLGEYKSKDGPTTTGKEEGLVKETTIFNYEKGKKTVIVETSFYNSDDKEVVKLKGEISKVVTTTTITNSENEELWKLTETVVYEYEKEKDTDGNVAKDKDGSTKYKKQDGKLVSTPKTTKVLTGQGFKAVYNQPEANDANFVELEKNGYTNFSNESFDYRLMLLNLFYTVLNDTSLYDIISDLAWSVAQTAKDAGVSMKKKNDQNNDKNLTLDKGENSDQTDGTTFNLFSTLKSLISDSSLTVNQKGNVVSLLTAAFYSKMRRASQTVSQLLVRLNYGADDQGLCLGDVIKVGGGFYIVIKVELDESGNYIVEAIPPLYKEVSSDKIQKAIPCPPLMPEIPTVRTAEAQVAFVEDNLDPNRFGRVRVRYPWQPEDGDKSPWVRMATPFATAGGGVTFRPCTGDEVLLNYEDGNIERPYIVGSLQSRYVTDPWLPLPDRVIRSKNGHSITFNDKTDGVDFLIGLSPAASFIRSVIPLYKPLITNQDMVDLTGGINITDRYGLYQINMSSDKRSVNIASPLGNVSLNAFTGITISAPNGNVKIEGKNVSISASNKLSLISGTAAGDHFVNPPDNVKSLGSWAKWGLGTMGEDVLNRTVGKWLDLSFFRTILEVFTRPVDGTLKIKSNSYVMIEAGKGKAEAPFENLEHPGREMVKSFDRAGHTLGDVFRSIDMLTSNADKICNNVKTAYENVKASATKYKALPGYNHLQKLKFGEGDNDELIQKIFGKRNEKKFKIKDIIDVNSFDFDNIEEFQFHNGGGQNENQQNENQQNENQQNGVQIVNQENAQGNLNRNVGGQNQDIQKKRDDIVSGAQKVGVDLKALFDAAKAWNEFTLSKVDKWDCYYSDGLQTAIRGLDIFMNNGNDGLIAKINAGTVSETTDLTNFAREMTILRRKIVYKLINEIKDDDNFKKLIKLEAGGEPTFDDDNQWANFSKRIKPADNLDKNFLTIKNSFVKWAKNYFIDGYVNPWIDAISITNRWRSAEKGRILLSDTPGATIHFNGGVLEQKDNIAGVISAYPIALQKKVNSV